jgi:hypothetical protein
MPYKEFPGITETYSTHLSVDKYLQSSFYVIDITDQQKTEKRIIPDTFFDL